MAALRTENGVCPRFVFHLEPVNTAGPESRFKVVSEYTKDYVYPLTQDTMENLSLSGVGAQITADLDAAKVIAQAKSSPSRATPQ